MYSSKDERSEAKCYLTYHRLFIWPKTWMSFVLFHGKDDVLRVYLQHTIYSSFYMRYFAYICFEISKQYCPLVHLSFVPS